jgi:hypothetical protein
MVGQNTNAGYRIQGSSASEFYFIPDNGISDLELIAIN